jgi:hypothetical protein
VRVAGVDIAAAERRRPGSGYRDLKTGALMAGATLYLATIGVDPTGRMRLVKSMSHEFDLHGRDQMALQTFTSFVLEFLNSKGIKSLQFIYSPAAGGHMASAFSYKVEAALQLLPLKVRLISSAAIIHRSHSADAPSADKERLGAARAKLQRRAIVAAGYSSAHAKVVSAAAATHHQVVTADPRFAAGAGSTAMRRESQKAETQERYLQPLAETTEGPSFADRMALIASL